MARVLVVDDVSDLRDVLSETLFEAGFDVTTVGSVAEAKEFLRRDELRCAVLLDLGLPDQSGRKPCWIGFGRILFTGVRQ